MRLDECTETIFVRMTCVVTERLDEELIWGGEVLLTVPEQDAGTVSDGHARRLGNKGGLPLAGLTGHQHDLPSVASKNTLCRVRQKR